jgi:hypothetical protein
MIIYNRQTGKKKKKKKKKKKNAQFVVKVIIPINPFKF